MASSWRRPLRRRPAPAGSASSTGCDGHEPEVRRQLQDAARGERSARPGCSTSLPRCACPTCPSSTSPTRNRHRRFREPAEPWLATRVDVGEGTKATSGLVFGRLLPRLGDAPGADLSPAVAEFVADLTEAGLTSGRSERPSQTLARVLDHPGIEPNPVRDPQVRCPARTRPSSTRRARADVAYRPRPHAGEIPAPSPRPRRVRDARRRAWSLTLGRRRRATRRVADQNGGHEDERGPVGELAGDLSEAIDEPARVTTATLRRGVRWLRPRAIRRALAKACTAPASPFGACTTSAIAASRSCTLSASVGSDR